MRSNLWINIDVANKFIIAGDTIGDIKCTEEEDDNKNTVEYYKNKNELLESMETVASEHRRKKVEKERERRRVLEGYFQKPYDKIDPELYKELRIVQTLSLKLPGISSIKIEHYFHNNDYNNHHVIVYQEDQKQESNNQNIAIWDSST